MSLRPRRRVRSRAALCVIAVCALLLQLLVVAGGATPAEAKGHRTPWPGGTWEPGPERYGVSIQTSVPITMQDGVKLNATIGYPTDKQTGQRARGTFPVIMQQNPYQPVGTTGGVNQYFVKHGYIFLQVDPRGTQSSQGTIDYFGTVDASDGVQLVAWAKNRLPGSNGSIGLFGCSYVGTLAIITAESVGPNSGVKAIATECPDADMYHDNIPGGIPSQVVPIYGVTGTLTGSHPETTAYMNALMADVLSGGPKAYGGAPHWQVRDLVGKADRIVDNNIATLIWEGWDSQAERSDLEFYTALQNSATSRRDVYDPMGRHQRTSGRYQMILGPWNHGAGMDDALNLEWFDTFVKGVKTGVEKTRTPLHLYERGTNRWVNAAQYPIASEYTQLYLGAQGALSTKKPKGGASDQIPWADPSTPGGTLTFQTAPYAKGATLAGHMSASLYAASSNRNLELIVTLYDVAPDGTATKLENGSILGSLRAIDQSRTWRDKNGVVIRPYQPALADDYLVPGAVNRYDFSLFPVVQGILPGHAIRATITTQVPAAGCGPAIGHDPCTLTTPQQQTLPGGVYTLERSARYPSALNLPILPYRALRTADSAVTTTSNGFEEPLDWG